MKQNLKAIEITYFYNTFILHIMNTVKGFLKINFSGKKTHITNNIIYYIYRVIQNSLCIIDL